MKITRKNYESYFLDYLEGSLDASLMEEMFQFLKENPDLNDELEELEILPLQTREIRFDGKEQLKKLTSTQGVVNENNFEQICIAKLEDDLNDEEERGLTQFIAEHPGKQNELDLFFKTKLQPGTEIFQNKQDLKKQTVLFSRKIYRYAIPAAASILLLIAFTFIITRNWLYQQNETLASAELIEANVVDEPRQPDRVAEKVIVPDKLDSEATEKSIITRSETSAEADASLVATQNTRLAETEPADIEMISSDNSETNRTGLILLAMKDLDKLPYHSNDNLVALKPVDVKNVSSDNYLTVREYLTYRIRGPESGDQNLENQDDKITLLDIADASVRGLSKIPGVNMKINRNYDENGDLDSYSFTSRNLSFTREVKNKGTL